MPASPPAGLSIGEVARRSGVPASTLRYYESAGLLPPPPRRHGRRRYDDAVFDDLALIGLARDAGFTLREIRTLQDGFAGHTPPSERWRTLVVQKLPEIDARLAQLRRMRRALQALAACRCETLSDCGHRAAAGGAARGR